MNEYTPNTETRAALTEYDEMKKNPGSYKRYESFETFMNDEQLTSEEKENNGKNEI